MRTTSGVLKVNKHLGGEAGPSEATLSCSFTPDGNWAAAATATGPVTFFPTVGDAHPCVFNPLGLSDENTALTSFKFSPTQASDNGLLAVSSSSTGRVQLSTIDPAADGKSHGKILCGVDEGIQTLSTAFSTDGAHIATGGTDQVIRLYSTAETQLEHVETFTQAIDNHGRDKMGHPNRIFSIKFNTPHTFLSGGWESSVLLYDMRAGKHAQRAFDGPRVSGDSIDFIHDAVVVGSDRTEDQLQVFDFGSGKQIGKPTTMDTMLFSVKAVERNGQLYAWCAGNKENALLCYELGTRKLVDAVTEVPESLFSVDVHPQSKTHLVFGGAHNVVYTGLWTPAAE